MTQARALIAGFVGVLAFVAGAHAADPPGSWRPPQPDEPPAFQRLMSGWYLRADVGFRWNGGGPSTADVTREKNTTSYDGTFGFGYKYQWFRADLTYDRSGPTRVTATTTAAFNQPQLNAKISSQTVLANGYVDFGTWGGFTPYVGAGFGIARLKSVDYLDTANSPSNNVFGVTSRGTQQNFAWAAMAGVAGARRRFLPGRGGGGCPIGGRRAGCSPPATAISRWATCPAVKAPGPGPTPPCSRASTPTKRASASAICSTDTLSARPHTQ